ncbi:caspase-13-like [Ochotona princeps]|uniref:caspase-13-like n=1 Tax=Ochotona princeps TaxID=9978 RepID=UPI002714E849|nr:caspase-13-like [Ochotona princeps]
MADRILKEKWSQFIHSMGTGTTNGLLDELLEKRVLNQEEMEKIRVENVTAKDKARALLSSVIPKGPEACQICISHICENDYHLAGLLGLSSGVQFENHLDTKDSMEISSSSSAPQAMQDTGVLTFSGPVGGLKLCPLETFQKMWKDKSEEIYPMIMKSPARTRLALIICNTDFDNLPRRAGADADIRNMKTLLTGLGYSVDVRENLNALDMATELKAFADRPEHCSSDSTFLVFMSHGTRAGICGKNYSEQCADILNVNTIFEKLNTKNCPNLKDKPKVIIIQACRGEDDNFKNPLKVLESMGKTVATSFMDNLVKKNVLKLEKEEKEKFYNAKTHEKAQILMSSMRDKHHENSQKFYQTFLNIGQNSTEIQENILGFWRSPEGLNFLESGKESLLSLHGFQNKFSKVFPETKTIPENLEEATATLKLCPSEDFLKLRKEKAEEIYPIKERKDRTRLALIICNIEFDHLPLRTGANHDIAGMKKLLEDLDYSVDVKEKLTAKDMKSVLQEFAARPEHSSSDSTFVVLMSHGILDGICGVMHSDKKEDVLPYDTIFQILNNRNCVSLKDKPKVIIVQACRGANRGEIWVSDSPTTMADSSSESPESLQDDAIYKTHVEKDFIAFCSSTPHNVSWRDVRKGSLFITQLISCFQKYSWCCHLEEVFRKVQQSFEKPRVKAQMPTIERLSMTRYFYLFPGN